MIARALAKEPADRYPSAGDLARAAAAAIEGEEVLRSAERSVATGKAAPETGEPANPPMPITDTVESEVAAEPDPEPTQPLSAVPEAYAATEQRTSETTVEPGSPPPRDQPPSPAGRGPRWGRIAGALAAAAVVLVVAVIALGGGGDGNVGAEQASSTPGGSGAAEPRRVGDPIDVATMPVGITVADGTVAVASRSGRALTLIDEGTRETTQIIDLPADGQEVAIDDDNAWVTMPTDSSVLKVPLGGGEAQPPIPVGSPPFGVASDGSSVWVAQPEAQQITSIDIADLTTAPTKIPESTEPTELAVSDGTIWVVDRNSELFWFEADIPGEQQSVGLGDNPKGVAVGGGSVWVANTDSSNVVEFDEDGNQLDSIDVGGEPRLVAYGFGRVWVANGAGRVDVIDPANDNSIETVGIEGSPEGVAVGSDEVWVTTGLNGDSVQRIDPGG